MVLFELVVIVLAAASVLVITKFDRDAWKKFLIIFIGILLFQFFTQALWLTEGLDRWAYLYLGVSWIITLGRATMVIVSVYVVDALMKKSSERVRFWVYLIPILILGIIAEAISTARGTIVYHEDLQALFSGVTIFGAVPIEALFYIPVFMLFVLSFWKYWEHILVKKSSATEAKA